MDDPLYFMRYRQDFWNISQKSCLKFIKRK